MFQALSAGTLLILQSKIWKGEKNEKYLIGRIKCCYIISITHTSDNSRTPMTFPTPCYLVALTWRFSWALLPAACTAKGSSLCSDGQSVNSLRDANQSAQLSNWYQHVTPFTSHPPKWWMYSIKKENKVCTIVLSLSYTYLILPVPVALAISLLFY